VCDTTTIQSLRSHQSLSPLLLTGFVDRTDQAFEPTQGYTVHMDVEHASALTFSDYRYNRGFLDGAYYLPLTRTHSIVLAMHGQLGIVRALASNVTGIGVLHPSKRFYAGGARSVRGYGENQLGPRILTVDEPTLRGDSIVHGDTIGTRCALSIPVTQCNPNAAGLTDGEFQPRPLGGTSLVAGSLELRFPVWPMFNLIGAVFVDGALVGESALPSVQDLSRLASGTGAITPGFGVRYLSPVGPIRVDAGYAPSITEDLRVVTATTVDGVRKIVPLTTARRYVQGSGSLLNRLVLHFSIGEAF
jgi:outer membrane protein assembly factor BamA